MVTCHGMNSVIAGLVLNCSSHIVSGLVLNCSSHIVSGLVLNCSSHIVYAPMGNHTVHVVWYVLKQFFFWLRHRNTSHFSHFTRDWPEHVGTLQCMRLVVNTGQCSTASNRTSCTGFAWTRRRCRFTLISASMLGRPGPRFFRPVNFCVLQRAAYNESHITSHQIKAHHIKSHHITSHHIISHQITRTHARAHERARARSHTHTPQPYIYIYIYIYI
jgi:hypothetical protein